MIKRWIDDAVLASLLALAGILRAWDEWKVRRRPDYYEE